MKTKIQEQYAKIWDKYESLTFKGSEILKRGFAYHYDDDEQGSDVLFIGINPSFSEGSELGISTFNRDNGHPYFNPFIDIAAKLDSKYSFPVKWTHLDLLVFRETNQKFIETEFFDSKEGLNFIMEQLMIAKERIEHIKPKVIVVSNALARRLMGKDISEDKKSNIWMGFGLKFSKEYGTDQIIDHISLNETPVFFTSMLSGQRALDIGTKERLIWHIAQVLKD